MVKNRAKMAARVSSKRSENVGSTKKTISSTSTLVGKKNGIPNKIEKKIRLPITVSKKITSPPSPVKKRSPKIKELDSSSEEILISPFYDSEEEIEEPKETNEQEEQGEIPFTEYDFEPPDDDWDKFAIMKQGKSFSRSYWIICRPEDWSTEWMNAKIVIKSYTATYEHVLITFVILHTLRTVKKLQEFKAPKNALYYSLNKKKTEEVIDFMNLWAESIDCIDFTEEFQGTPEYERQLQLSRVRFMLRIMPPRELDALEKHLYVLKEWQKTKRYLLPTDNEITKEIGFLSSDLRKETGKKTRKHSQR